MIYTGLVGGVVHRVLRSTGRGGNLFPSPSWGVGYPRGHARSISWSIRGLDFFVLSGTRFPFGPLRPRFSWSISGARFFLVLRGLELLVHSGLDFLVRLGTRFFFWSFRGLDFRGPFGASIFFGPSRARFFMIPFGDPLLGPFGAQLLP